MVNCNTLLMKLIDRALRTKRPILDPDEGDALAKATSQHLHIADTKSVAEIDARTPLAECICDGLHSARLLCYKNVPQSKVSLFEKNHRRS